MPLQEIASRCEGVIWLGTERFIYRCPLCEQQSGFAQQDEQGAVTLSCDNGCPEKMLASALSPPAEAAETRSARLIADNEKETVRRAGIHQWELDLTDIAAACKRDQPDMDRDVLREVLLDTILRKDEHSAAPAPFLVMTPSEIEGSVESVLSTILTVNGNGSGHKNGTAPPPPAPSPSLGQYRKRYQKLLDQPWPVKETFCPGCVSLLTSKKGIGKSTLFRTLVKGLMTATDFLGREIPAPIKVLYLPLEAGGMPVILGFEKAGIDPDHPMLVLEDEIPGDRKSLDQRIAWVKERILANQATFVIVDTLGRFNRIGGNEDYGGTTEIVGELEKVARQTNSHIIYAHHVGKGRSDDAELTGSALGSAGIETAAQAHLHLRGRARATDDGQGIVTIEIGDMRVGKPLAETLLVWDRETDLDSLGEPWKKANRAMLQKAKLQLKEFFLQVNPEDWWTVGQVVTESGVNRRWGSWALSEMAKEGLLEKVGEGKRGSPFKYRAVSAQGCEPPSAPPDKQGELYKAG